MLSRSKPDRSIRLLMTAEAAWDVWSYALELAAGLTHHGVATTLAVLGPSPSSEQRRDALAVPDLTLVDTGMSPDWMAPSAAEVRKTGRAVAELAKQHGADAVHLNGPALAADATFPAPVVAVSHSCCATWWAAMRGGPLPRDLAWRADLVAEGLNAAEINVAPTRAFANATAAAHGLAIPVRVVRNGRAPVPQSGDFTDVVNCVFTAGRLWDEGTNLVALDRAAAHLRVPAFAAGPLVGPDGVRRDCRALSPLGRLDDRSMRSWLVRRPVFVSTALYEPLGFAVLDAARAGCALILSDIPSFRELWDGAAEFVSPDDDFAIASAIARAIGDRDHRRRLGALASKHARRYCATAMVEGMLAAYLPHALDRTPFGDLSEARV